MRPYAGLNANRLRPFGILLRPEAQLVRRQARARRLQPLQWQTSAVARHASSDSGDHQSGHIEAGVNEGILFFDSVFPLKLQSIGKWLWFLPSSITLERIKRPSPAGVDPEDIVHRALPKHPSLHINKVIPRLKDGGAFVTFAHGSDVTATQVEQSLREYMKKEKIRPWWNPLTRMRTHLVRGRPWIEDLYRPPSCRLKVEFEPPAAGQEGAELSQEQLYSIFRPYGKLVEIESQPPDSKVLPKYAYLDFAGTKRAIMARNCLHGWTVPRDNNIGGALAKLSISYEKQKRQAWIRDWLANHPRIVIPLLAALITALTIAVFDPIRTFFVKAHISQTFHLSQNRLYRWLTSRATNLLTFRRGGDDEASLAAVRDDRKEQIEQLQTWLMEAEGNFIIVQGPRGAGKRDLVCRQALENKKNKLIIDCKPIQEARSDSATINAMAGQVGYKPVFSWMNSISGLVDLAAQGATGMKTGFSETLDSQLDKILNNTGAALKQISLEDRKSSDKDAQLGEDEYLEAHPERRPIVIIDNFLHKAQEGTIICDKIAEWAARITTGNIAHVIFLTTDVSFNKSLSKAMPERIFHSLSLSDFSRDAAKRFVVSHLEFEPGDVEADQSAKPLTPWQRRKDLAQLDECIDQLGGRLTDLEYLARRIKAGESPLKAVREIIDQSASEILKMYVTASANESRAWSPEHAWTLIKLLAATGQKAHAARQTSRAAGAAPADTTEEGVLRYNAVVMSGPFASSSMNPDVVLEALEQAELISIVSAHGRPVAIKPGKPVFLQSFRQLAADRVLRARMDVMILSKVIKDETAGIAAAEAELKTLGDLPKRPVQLAERVTYLLNKVQGGQQRLEAAEREVAELKKTLVTEF